MQSLTRGVDNLSKKTLKLSQVIVIIAVGVGMVIFSLSDDYKSGLGLGESCV